MSREVEFAQRVERSILPPIARNYGNRLFWR